jgi:hypothetical protein
VDEGIPPEPVHRQNLWQEQASVSRRAGFDDAQGGVMAMDLFHIGVIVLIVLVLAAISWWGNNGKPGLPG